VLPRWDCPIEGQDSFQAFVPADAKGQVGTQSLSYCLSTLGEEAYSPLGRTVFQRVLSISKRQPTPITSSLPSRAHSQFISESDGCLRKCLQRYWFNPGPRTLVNIIHFCLSTVVKNLLGCLCRRRLSIVKRHVAQPRIVLRMPIIIVRTPMTMFMRLSMVRLRIDSVEIALVAVVGRSRGVRLTDFGGDAPMAFLFSG